MLANPIAYFPALASTNQIQRVSVSGLLILHFGVFLCGCSEYAGQTLPVANGDGVFLDVKWLSTALKPILSHVLQRMTFRCPTLSIMRDEFVDHGVLRQELAEELWSREMGGPLVREGLLGALCRVVLDLGVALPLDPASLLSDPSGNREPFE